MPVQVAMEKRFSQAYGPDRAERGQERDTCIGMLIDADSVAVCLLSSRLACTTAFYVEEGVLSAYIMEHI